MSPKQAKWMAEHPGYVLVSSWGGPYLYSGILYADGSFNDDPESMPAYGCLVVGERQPLPLGSNDAGHGNEPAKSGLNGQDA